MVLKRDDDGTFSLAPYEFKARPWRYEEYREFPVRLTLDDGCYRLSFGEHSEDPDAATNEGDVMRVQVTVPQQTGYSTGAVIRQGWVIAKAFTAASTYAAGKKLCVNEGSYWSWWSCDKDFNGAADFVDGLTSPADYPDFSTRGLFAIPIRLPARVPGSSGATRNGMVPTLWSAAIPEMIGSCWVLLLRVLMQHPTCRLPGTRAKRSVIYG